MEGFMRYAVVIEQAGEGFSAYVPDLPGCVAAGKSSEEVERLIRGAIEIHLSGLREDGELIPDPVSRVEYIEIN
jgi:predicted RNase H-like HicB family nuclease